MDGYLDFQPPTDAESTVLPERNSSTYELRSKANITSITNTSEPNPDTSQKNQKSQNQIQDSGLGNTIEKNVSKDKKRRRDSVDAVSVQPKAQKKRKTLEKTPNVEFDDEVKKLANQDPCVNLESNETIIKFDVKPNKKNVSAEVSVWKAKELYILVIFPDHKEAIEIVNSDFGKWATKAKIEWLQKLVTRISLIGSKEELFPECMNWIKYIKFRTPPGFARFDDIQLKQIEQFSRAAANQTIINKFGRVIKGRDIHRLCNPASNDAADLWLDDQVINQCLDMISHRSNLLRVHSIDSHFYPTLCDYGYERAASLIRNGADVFDCDLLMVPIHRNNHWLLAIIKKNQRQIELYNSLHHAEYRYEIIFLTLFGFLQENGFDTEYWTTHIVEGIPQQQNGFDCGVFTLVYAEYASRGKFDFDFSQIHIPFFRSKILYEICTGEKLR